ncbi:MAG: DNA primase [bacterium]|nr:DNA primase [bacterium]
MNETEEIKNRLDIVEVIGSYIQLKQAGRNFKAFSPFHQEKNPSFMVSPEKNIWHDFSTDEGGDIFTFVMKIEGISFPEALEMLAKKAGVTLKKRTPQQQKIQSKKTKLYEANELSTKYFQASLAKNRKALKYLVKERGLKTQTIKKYQLGYAPNAWEALSKFLIKKGFDGSDLKLAGLIGQKDRTKIFDIFRGRIIFPIFDTQGRVVGYSGRILDEDTKAAKYLNTPQTPIYNKSSVIYGLYQAKDAIREKDEVIAVEGNMDVIGLANSGQENVVAISGTALTRQQLLGLSRLTKNIKVCFDSDEAGIKATQRAIELASELVVKLMVISFKDAKDPDELIKKDKKSWDKAVKSAKYAPDYLFDLADEKFDKKSAVGKKNYSDFLLDVINSLSDEVERDHYIKLLSEKLSVSYDSVRQKLKGAKTKQNVIQNSNTNEKEQKISEKKSKNQLIEENLLEILLAFDFTRSTLDGVDLNDITEENREAFNLLAKNPEANLETFAKQLKNKQNYVKILALKGEQEYSDLPKQDLSLEAHAQMRQLHHLNLETKKKELSEEIAKAEESGNKALAKKLLAKYQELINEE